MRMAVASSVSFPKVMVPRLARDTVMPVPVSVRYSMSSNPPFRVILVPSRLPRIQGCFKLCRPLNRARVSCAQGGAYATQ